MMVKSGKFVTILSVIIIAMLVVPTPALAANPNKTMGEPAFVLNVLGKKADWNPGGEFDNPDRHTIFVPEGSSGTAVQTKIWITQALKGSLLPFAVIDGNGFDEDGASLQLGDGYYACYIAALGKPVGEGSTLGGMVTSPDGTDLFFLGGVDANALRPHGKTPVWEDYSNLFYITYAQMVTYFEGLGFSNTTIPTATQLADDVWTFFESSGLLHDIDGDGVGDSIWIFDFYTYIVDVLTVKFPDIAGDLNAGQYYWDLKNQGIRHLQIRFYKISSRDWQYIAPETIV